MLLHVVVVMLSFWTFLDLLVLGRFCLGTACRRFRSNCVQTRAASRTANFRQDTLVWYTFSFSLFFFSANRQQRQLRCIFIIHKPNSHHNSCSCHDVTFATSPIWRRWISCDVANIELMWWLFTLMASLQFGMTASLTPTLILAKLYYVTSTSTCYYSHVMLRYLYQYLLTKLVLSLHQPTDGNKLNFFLLFGEHSKDFLYIKM